MTVILMSRSEIDRMNVLRYLAEERIRVSDAATLIGLGRRQVLRLAKAFRQRGPTPGVAPTPPLGPTTRKGGYTTPQTSDFCNWRKSDFSKWL